MTEISHEERTTAASEVEAVNRDIGAVGETIEDGTPTRTHHATHSRNGNGTGTLGQRHEYAPEVGTEPKFDNSGYDVMVAIPAYNEEATIDEVVRRVRSLRDVDRFERISCNRLQFKSRDTSPFSK